MVPMIGFDLGETHYELLPPSDWGKAFYNPAGDIIVCLALAAGIAGIWIWLSWSAGRRK